MANQNQRYKNGYMHAMGDGYRNPDIRKFQANKKVQAEDDNYSSGDDAYDHVAGDRLTYKAPPGQPKHFNPRYDYRIHGDVPYVERVQQQQHWRYQRQEAPPKPRAQTAPQTKQAKNQMKFEQLRDTFINVNSNPNPDKNMNRFKFPDTPQEVKDEFIKECCEEAYNMNLVEKNSKGQHLLKTPFRPPQGHESDHSENTYTHQQEDLFSNSDQFSESSEEKGKKRPTNNHRTGVNNKPSARSNGTNRSKKAEELVNLQKLKSDIIEVIQDGIQKIEKTTCEKPSRESQNLPHSSTSSTNQNSDILQCDILTTFVKQLRDNHLGNILHEVKNLHFLESLPERCQNDLNKKREY